MEASLPTYMAQMLPPDFPPDDIASAQQALVEFAAAFELDVPISKVQVRTLVITHMPVSVCADHTQQTLVRFFFGCPLCVQRSLLPK